MRKALLVCFAMLAFVGTAQAGRPIYTFALGGAYVDSDLVSQFGQKANPDATKNTVRPLGMYNDFRYSGGLRDPGFVPASNSVQIHYTRGHVTTTGNHLAAWEGINGTAVCAGGAFYCNWLQAGIMVGQSCFVGSASDQRYLYFEIQYGTTSEDCPATNGQGYFQGGLGAVSASSTHTVVMYLCGLVGGCNYTDSCNGHITWPTSYHRTAVLVDGCFRSSNVYVDDPSSGQRQIVAPLEDFFGNLNGDYGTAEFANSTNTFQYWFTGTGACGGLYSGNKAWQGCLNAN